MRRPILTLAGLVMISACSSEAPAQSDATAAQDSVVETPTESLLKPTAVKGTRQEKRYIQAMEDGLQSQMKLYSRVSPEIAEKIKPVNFDAADRDVIRCSFKGMKRAGLSKYVEAGIEANQTLNQAIEDTPNLSIKTIEQHPEIMSLMQGGDMLATMSDADADKVQVINQDCGVMGMMTKKMTESGVMAALTSTDME